MGWLGKARSEFCQNPHVTWEFLCKVWAEGAAGEILELEQSPVLMGDFSRCCKVRAGESLMKLVSDLKQFLILNDFPSVNEAINQRNQQLRSLQEECDKKLIALRDEISIDLYELEEEYYSSRYK